MINDYWSMGFRSFAAAILAILPPSDALAADYIVDTGRTRPTFRIEHRGFAAQFGHFNKVEGQVSLNIQERQGSVDLIIHVGSLEMTPAKAAEHLMGEGLLDVKRFPVARFASDKLVFRGDAVVGVKGRFTLLGITKPIDVSVNGFRCQDREGVKYAVCSGEVVGSLLRLDFGLTKYRNLVGDQIEIRIPIAIYMDRSSIRPPIGRSVPTGLRPNTSRD